MDDRLNKARILIVDDSLDAVELLSVILGRENYSQVRGLTEPRQAAEIYREWQPDLVLLDIMMPGFDGFAVIGALREMEPLGEGPPILVISADRTSQTRQRALASGAADFVAKPYDYTEILLRVRNLLRTRLITQDLRESQAQAQALSQRLIQAQEDERQALSRELHDEIGQTLTIVKINLQSLRRSLQTPGDVSCDAPYDSAINQSISIVENALRQVRDLSLNLRPAMLDDFGLVDTIVWYVERQAQLTGLDIHFSCKNSPCRQLPTLETTCFRVVQEALTNVMRHAQAKNVWIELDCTNGQLELTVRDDGQGFDVTQTLLETRGHSLGLAGLRERVALAQGQLTISSMVGQGTTIYAFFPADDFTGAD